MDIASLYSKLESFIKQFAEKLIDTKLRNSYLISRKAIIINNYDSTSNSASIIIPTDKLNPTNYYYPNRSGQVLVSGQKAYLVYQTGNISQGWIENNNPFDIVDTKIFVKKSGDIMTGNLTVPSLVISGTSFTINGVEQPVVTEIQSW